MHRNYEDGEFNYFGGADSSGPPYVMRRAHSSHTPRRRCRSRSRSPDCRGRRASPKRVSKKPWVKYWASEPAPDLLCSNTHGSGPFRETALQTPLEAKDTRAPYIGRYMLYSKVGNIRGFFIFAIFAIC